MFSLAKDRKVLISGGAGGLGLAIAARLLAEGARVAVLDIDESALERATTQLNSPSLRAIVVDVTNAASVASGVATAVEAFGGIDSLVTSAGVYHRRPFLEVSEDEWDWHLRVNLTGTFLLLQSAMPLLVASGRGRVVNISSVAGKRGLPTLAAYCASKFAIIGLTESVAMEFARMGVTANCVIPGTVPETGMGHEVVRQKIELGFGDRDEILKQATSAHPLGRLGTPDDIADAVMFLLSESASWITGAALNVDGGWLAAS